jgi:energy-coupling factor transport system substrate-specific component
VVPTAEQSVSSPLITAVLLVLALLALLIEIQGATLSAKTIATLGILVAITATLRFLETAIPGPGGFSPIFAPIILAGYVYGARFGFLMGTLTLLVSALIGGGVGPWLPYQMFAAGWIGLGAGWLPTIQDNRLLLLLLAGYSFVSGVIYGALLNLTVWPFIAGDIAASYSADLGWRTALAHYGTFYVGTSLLWDLLRGFGNVILILILGIPAVRALQRFQQRFVFEHRPATIDT